MKKLTNYYHSLSQNDRIVIINVIGAFSIKGLSLIISLFTMPAYIKFFNNQVSLGLWFTILSVLSWILNFDLGIGNGLRNHLASTLIEEDYTSARKYISSAYISIGLFCLVTITLFSIIFSYIDWNQVLKIDVNIISPKSLLLAIKIVFICIMLQLFFKLISSILYATQKSAVNNVLTLSTSSILVISVSLIPSRDNDWNLICMALIYLIAVILPLVIATVIVFYGNRMRSLLPSLRFFSRDHYRNVISLGGKFFFVQIMYMFIMSTNEYLITYLCGNENVVFYKIYNQVFTLGATLFTMALTPIWSAVTKSFIERNFQWIKITYRRLVLLAFLGALCEFLAIPFIQILLDFWLKENTICVDYYYASIFAGLGSVMIFNSVFSSIANGLGALRIQAICFGIGAIIKVPIAIIMVMTFGTWIGVVVANIIPMAIFCIIQPLSLRITLKRLEYMSNRNHG